MVEIGFKGEKIAVEKVGEYIMMILRRRKSNG